MTQVLYVNNEGHRNGAVIEGSNPLAVMVGGTHYKGGIQPVEFYNANPQLNFQQCNMIKYAYRHKDKKGTEDLLKVIHYAMLEVQFQYPKELEEFKEKVKGLL